MKKIYVLFVSFLFWGECFYAQAWFSLCVGTSLPPEQLWAVQRFDTETIDRVYRQQKPWTREAAAMHLLRKKKFCYEQEQGSFQRVHLPERFVHTKQEHTLSCEANSIKDLLNYYLGPTEGISLEEKDILAVLPFDTARLESYNGKKYWGDPEVGFVGSVTWPEGRWVYPKPLLPIVDSYLFPLGYKSYEQNTLSEDAIVSSLIAGHPFVFWYVSPAKGKPQEIPVITSQGRKMILYKNQHVWLVVGVKVSFDATIKTIYFYDWLHAEKQKMTYDDFVEATSYFTKFLFVGEKDNE